MFFDFILKNQKLLIGLLVMGITFAIISAILGLTMKVTATMIASFVMCFLAIIFISFAGYNLYYNPKSAEQYSKLKEHLASSSSSSPSSDIGESPTAQGGYFYYGD